MVLLAPARMVVGGGGASRLDKARPRANNRTKSPVSVKHFATPKKAGLAARNAGLRRRISLAPTACAGCLARLGSLQMHSLAAGRARRFFEPFLPQNRSLLARQRGEI